MKGKVIVKMGEETYVHVPDGGNGCTGCAGDEKMGICQKLNNAARRGGISSPCAHSIFVLANPPPKRIRLRWEKRGCTWYAKSGLWEIVLDMRGRRTRIATFYRTGVTGALYHTLMHTKRHRLCKIEARQILEAIIDGRELD